MPLIATFVLLSAAVFAGCVAPTPTPIPTPTPTPIPPPQTTVKAFIEAVLAGRTEEAAGYVCGGITIVPLPVKAAYQLKLVDNDDAVARVQVVGDFTVTFIVTIKKHFDFTLTLRWNGVRWCIDETSFRAFWKTLTTPGGVAD
ncbi:MAG: hypothetical protein NT169_21425 [Chloroflexi bacterium]|nr:hypothetical protein [Chloroflexota bacterium]